MNKNQAMMYALVALMDIRNAGEEINVENLRDKMICLMDIKSEIEIEEIYRQLTL